MDVERKSYTYHYSYGNDSSLRGQPPNQNGPTRPPRLRRTFVILLLIVVIAGVSYAFFNAHHNKPKVLATKTPPIVAHTPTSVVAATPSAASLEAAKITAMGNNINSIINQNTSMDISVSLIDLSNNQAEHYGDPTSYNAASTAKVITAVDFLQEVENGQQSLSETINGQTAQYDLQQMIVVSNDEAWEDLNNTLGYAQLQAYAQSIGTSNYQALANTDTSDDMALVLEKLYEGKLLNASDTQLLLSYMKEANYTQYIVPAVPATDTIYQKVGIYAGDLHDEAIIVDGNQAFVIAIFTYGPTTADFPARALVMQQITQDALATYF